MMGVENVQGQVTSEWFAAFNHNFGVSPKKTSSLQLLEELWEKKPRELEESSPNPKLARRLPKRFRESKSELLVSQEDAEEVIDCCISVLEAIYGISLSVPYSIKLCHLNKGGTPVEIENIPGFGTIGKTQAKRLKWTKKHKEENIGLIKVSCNASYVSVVIAFLEKCFRVEVGKLSASENSEVSKDLKDTQGIRKIAQSIETEEGQSKEQEELEREKEELENEKKQQFNKRKPHLIVWLVANCLYTMGELACAKQYIVDYQKDRINEGFNEVCKTMGIPWNEQGKKLNMDDMTGDREGGKEEKNLPKRSKG